MMAGVARPGDVKQSLRQPRTESRKSYSLGGSLEFLPSLIVQKTFFGLLVARSPIALRDYFRTMQRPPERSQQYFSIWHIFVAASELHAIQHLLNLIQWILSRRTGSMGNDRDLNRTRRQLMKAALTEFAAKGFAGARTDAIARRAGVDERMIYYCFKTKEGLYREVLRSKLAEEAHIVDSNEGDDFATALVKGYESCSSDSQQVRMWLWEALDTGRRKIAAEEERRALFEREKARIRRAQLSGHLTADIDEDLLLLVRIGLLVAPTTLPQVTRLLTGMDAAD